MNDQTPQTLATPDGAASVLTDGLGVIDPAWDTDTATMDITTARNSVDVLRLEIVRRGCLEMHLREEADRLRTGIAYAAQTLAQARGPAMVRQAYEDLRALLKPNSEIHGPRSGPTAMEGSTP